MSEFTLLIVCIVVGLINIFLSLTLLAFFAYLFPTATKNAVLFRKVILVISLVLAAVIAFFIWYYAMSLSMK
jgi:hypothetical protein